MKRIEREIPQEVLESVNNLENTMKRIERDIETGETGETYITEYNEKN